MVYCNNKSCANLEEFLEKQGGICGLGRLHISGIGSCLDFVSKSAQEQNVQADRQKSSVFCLNKTCACTNPSTQCSKYLPAS